MTTCGRQTKEHLERVINEPLRTSQGADHKNADGETVPQAFEANIPVYSGNGLESALTVYPNVSTGTYLRP